jgi:hypothetical protein
VSLQAKVAELMQLRKPKELDEIENARRRERGAKAEALLRDEALQDAFKALDEAYTKIWRTSVDPEDVGTRERAWAFSKVLDDLRNHLLSVVRDGAVAQRELEKSLR